MKNLSIRVKITMWFTLILVFITSCTYVIVFSVNRQLMQKTIRDELIRTVEDNVDEVEYYKNIGKIDPQEVDYYMAFRGGYLEIDDDFLDKVNEVYTSLYNEDVTLLYGENPISRQTADLEFADAKIQHLTVNDTLYYIFDRKLVLEGLEGLWLRGVVSENQGMTQMAAITQLLLLFLPLFVVLAVIGGYLFARRMLRPIQEISDSAARIGGSGDLKERIELGGGNDELHQLAAGFNEMFQRLEDAFETERQFTSDASHELRTPISVITAQCEMTLEETRSVEEYELALRTIQRQGRKMSKLINDMLDFTRLEMRAESYTRESVDMTELVRSVCFDMALIKEKNITLKCDVQEGVRMQGNRQLLSRLLANLISNAYRYGRDDGCILVGLKLVGQGTELSVCDNGIGILPEEQTKIFRRFYQADNSHSGLGTGLGLSMAYEIAQFHGGEIRVESEPGKGSKFTVILKN
jgi:signal transduction histidine kinase